MFDSGDEVGGSAPAAKRRLQLARRVVGRIAASAEDPAEALRIATALNDAYLRLQFALVIDDGPLISAQRRAWASLLAEARRSATESRPESRAA